MTRNEALRQFVAAPGFRRDEIVSTLARFEAIGPAWDALWRRTGLPVFQSHEWIRAWWRDGAGAQAHRPLIALAWHGEILIAALPVAVSRRRGLRFLEWAARDISDYCDALIDPSADQTVLPGLWRSVSRQGGFDIAMLARLKPDAVAFRLAGPGNGAIRLHPDRRVETSSRVESGGRSGAAWFGAFPKKIRQNYRRGTYVLSADADMRFRLIPADAPVGPVLERLGEFKRLWLARNNLVAPLFDAGAPLLPALADILGETGQLRLFVLERDAEIIAVSLNFVQDDALMAFLTSYDPTFERGSPGMILMMDYIRWAFDNGLPVVDFLTGYEGFKARFATSQITLSGLIGARSLIGHAAIAVDRLRAAYRRRSGGSGSARPS
jgi:CelD/BcsL family acetyltransferase involved in cellulose biosynthesis